MLTLIVRTNDNKVSDGIWQRKVCESRIIGNTIKETFDKDWPLI